MDIKIENGIPIPTKKHAKYNWIDDMKIGQSFTIPYAVRSRSIFMQAFRTRKMKCIIRRDGDKLRIWRVE